MNDEKFMQAAIEQAKAGRDEGGVPIGAVLVVGGKVIGLGHNRHIQKGSVILHAEMDCLENTGRLSHEIYRKATLYTTLSPCSMCSGAVLLYKIPRVVFGENKTFTGAEAWLEANGVEVVDMKSAECEQLMKGFEKSHQHIWLEDIGE